MNNFNSKFLLFFILIVISQTICAQDKIDSVIDKMCKEVDFSRKNHDSIIYKKIMNEYLVPYALENNGDNIEDGVTEIYVRAQKKCLKFNKIVSKIYPIESQNWIMLSEMPQITISEKELKAFKNINRFYYKEYTTNFKTIVELKDGFWAEKMKDESHSILKMKWIETNRIELEFIESNDPVKKGFSRKGDKYYYRVLNKEDNFYWILFESSSNNTFVKFKLYPEN